MKFLIYTLFAAGTFFGSYSLATAQKPAQKAAPKTIVPEEMPWQTNRRLTWNDFTGTAGPKETKYALTTSGISVGTNCSGGKFTYQVKAVFVPKESWTRDRTSESLLAHEQAHFDITELHARKLRLVFSQLPDGCLLSQEQISRLVEPIYAESDRMQAEYDKITSHGINKEAQKQWEQLIAASLRELEMVAQP